ncbi:MAG: glycerol-3-phosphate 1-O-acyltransferase PlsY [Planctomycetales bacterium]
MNPWLASLCTIVIAYFAGSIPFGYLTARLVRGIDIRQHGSRNIGATNIGRVLGTRWGLFVFVLDGLKGYLPVFLIPAGFANASSPQTLAVVAGFGTILGHMYPCWLGFSGGKGVATALGVAAALASLETGIAAATFLIVFAVSRIISLSSMTAALAFAITHVVRLRADLFTPANLPLSLFSFLIPALILWRHRANIGRLLNGTEPRYTSGKPQPPITKS